MMYEFVSDSYDGRVLKVTIEVLNSITQENRTNIRYNFISEGGNSDYYSIGETTIEINGTTYYHIDNRSFVTKKFPAAKGDVGERSISIPHNSDGTKTLTVVFKTSIGSILGTAVNYGGEIVLPPIDRTPPTLNLSVDKVTDTSARLYIDTFDDACYQWQYLMNETFPYAFFSGNNYSTVSKGAFRELTELEANQTYTVKVRASKYENNVYADSNVVTFTTFGASSLSSVENLIIDEPSASLKVDADVYNQEYNHSLCLCDKSTEILTLHNCKLINGLNTIALTEDEIDAILSYMSHCKELNVSLTLLTTSSDLQVGETSSKALTIKTSFNSHPIFNGFSYADISENSINVTQNNQILIQGVSELQITTSSATPKNNAEIVSYSAMVGTSVATSAECTLNVGKLSVSGSVPIIVTAIDSRGYTASQTIVVNVIPYKKVDIISAVMDRINQVESFTKVKVVAEISPVVINGEDKNLLKDVLYRYKKTDKNESFSNYYSAKNLIEISDNKITFETHEWVDLELDPEFSYYVEFIIDDQFSESTRDRITLTIPQATPTASFRKAMVGINNRNPRAALDVVGQIMMNGFNIFSTCKSLSADDHLDDIVTSGIYESKVGASIGDQNGYPTKANGILLLFVTEGFVLQIFVRAGSQGEYIYYRVGTLSNDITTWKNWYQFTLKTLTSTTEEV